MGPAPKSYTPCNQHLIDVEPGKISEKRACAFNRVKTAGKDEPGLIVPSPAQAFWRSLGLIILCWFRSLWHIFFLLLCSVLVRSWLCGFISEKRAQPLKPVILFQWEKSKCFINSWFFQFLLLLDFFGVLHYHSLSSDLGLRGEYGFLTTTPITHPPWKSLACFLLLVGASGFAWQFEVTY